MHYSTKENLVFIGEEFGGVKMFGEIGVMDSESSHWEWSAVAKIDLLRIRDGQLWQD